jgi:hypothetical protein
MGGGSSPGNYVYYLWYCLLTESLGNLLFAQFALDILKAYAIRLQLAASPNHEPSNN